VTVRRGRRRTARTRLALLYAGPFFVSGALLLVFPLLSINDTTRVGGGGPAHPTVAPGAGRVALTATGAGLAVTAVLALLLGWLVAGRFLRPLRDITATARDISATSLDRRLALPGRANEFTELADTLDDLFGRLRDSFESQRHFVANASHELRTPLTAERALLQVALADPDASADSLRATCRDLLELSGQQERLIGALLTLATSEQGVEHRLPVDLAQLAADAVRAREDDADRRGIRVDADLAAARVTGDPHLLESLVTNLLDNALRHNVTGGWLRITTAAGDHRPTLTVGNTGAAIPPDELDRLFQPFQQLDGQRVRHAGGHGLGLAIVAAITRAHHATLHPEARPAGGLHITVTFPAPGSAP
jgi:signal transduction histidine kinase